MRAIRTTAKTFTSRAKKPARWSFWLISSPFAEERPAEGGVQAGPRAAIRHVMAREDDRGGRDSHDEPEGRQREEGPAARPHGPTLPQRGGDSHTPKPCVSPTGTRIARIDAGPVQHTNPGGVMHTNRNIAARAGCWSARHRKTAILGWLAFVIIAFGIGGAIGTKQLGNAQTSRTGE